MKKEPHKKKPIEDETKNESDNKNTNNFESQYETIMKNKEAVIPKNIAKS